jgi:hypothetical protein
MILLESLYNSDVYKGKYPSRYLFDAFLDIIERIAVGFPSIYIIIDGIDEIVDRGHLLIILNTVTNKLKNLHLLVVSRPERDIEISFKGKSTLFIHEPVIHSDISAFVDYQFEHDDKLSRLKSGLKDEIKDALLMRSGGMYSSCQ